LTRLSHRCSAAALPLFTKPKFIPGIILSNQATVMIACVRLVVNDKGIALQANMHSRNYPTVSQRMNEYFGVIRWEKSQSPLVLAAALPPPPVCTRSPGPCTRSPGPTTTWASMWPPVALLSVFCSAAAASEASAASFVSASARDGYARRDSRSTSVKGVPWRLIIVHVPW